MSKYNGDMHVHSKFSKYSHESIGEIINIAEKNNLDFIALTDDANFRIQPVNEVIHRLEERNKRIDDFCMKTGVKIIKGIEIAEPHLYTAEIDYIKERLELDYVLACIHHIMGAPLEKMSGNKIAYYKYLESLLKTVSEADIDAVAHLDYIKRFITDQEFDIELLEQIFKKMIERNIALEINTSGFRNHLSTFPERNIVELYKSLGGDKVVFGSSAHHAHNVYNHIEETDELFDDLELNKGYVYKRKFKQIK